MASFTGSITLASVYDGDPAEGYRIESNQGQIYKFYNTEQQITFTPDILNIWVIKNENNSDTILIPGTDYNTTLEILGWDEITDIWTFASDFEVEIPISYGESETIITETDYLRKYIRNIENNIISFTLSPIFSATPTNNNTTAQIDTFNNLKQKISEENIYLIIKLYDNSGNITSSHSLGVYQTFPLEFGTSDDMAKFRITSNAIQAAVDNSMLTFDGSYGLTIKNGGIRIFNDHYIENIPPDPIPTNTYYEYNGHDYILTQDEHPQESKTYYTHVNDQLFGYNETGGLFIKGNSEFTGTVYATAGSFTGEVNAQTLTGNKGYIGGWILKENGLYSNDNLAFNSNITYYEYNDGTYQPVNYDEPNLLKTYYVLVDNTYIPLNIADVVDTTNTSIQLMSNDNGVGNIKATYIELGEGATIKKSICLNESNPKVYIYNPNDSEAGGKFLEAGNVTLTQDGILNLGNIILDGVNSRIYGTRFSITPDVASFENVTVSGKIATTVFETNHTQAVGGSMFFKPSYKITSVSGTQITLDTNYPNESGNYIYLVRKDGTLETKYYQINNVNNNIVTLDTAPSQDVTYNTLIDLGTNDSVIIGVNSNDSGVKGLLPRGITISKFNINNNEEQFSKPKVFIGDLSHAEIDPNITGFGLYSENVFLTGSLITQVQNSYYAGVNTLDGVINNKFSNDPSEIIFWAGSEDTTPANIKEAPFQVTRQGSIYATRGRFTGEITSSDIYTSRIHGTNNSSEYGLAFYDIVDGIVFKEGGQTDDTAVKVFTIGQNGFSKRDGTAFIGIQDVFKEGITYYTLDGGNYVNVPTNSIPQLNTTYYLLKDGSYIEADWNIDFDQKVSIVPDNLNSTEYLTDTRFNYLKMYNQTIELHDYSNNEIFSQIIFDINTIKFKATPTTNDIILNSNQVNFNSSIAYFDNNISFKNKLLYKKNENNYYDLYVE